MFSEVKRYICPILIYNTSHICEKHTFTRYYASYVFHLWFVHNKLFLMNSEKRQEIMLLFTPVRRRKITTSRSILTIPIGIRMNFVRGLSVMAVGFIRICSFVTIPIRKALLWLLRRNG